MRRYNWFPILETVARKQMYACIYINITVAALTLVSVVASPGETMATPTLQLFILRVCGGVLIANCLLK